MDSITGTIRKQAVLMHGEKILDRDFTNAPVDAMDIGLTMVSSLVEATGVNFDIGAVNPAAGALNRIRAEFEYADIYHFAQLVWSEFFDAALAGRTSTGEDSATDLLGRPVRVGDVLAYSRADMDGTSSIELGLVSRLHSNDLVSGVATMAYGENGQRLGGSLSDGATAKVGNSLLARK